MNVPQDVNVGPNTPGNSSIYGITNTPLAGDYAITAINARAGNTSTSEVVITSLLEGPYMFDHNVQVFAISIVSQYSPVPMPGNLTIVNIGNCTGNSTCQQELRFTIQHAGACRLDGNYSIHELPVICQPDLPTGMFVSRLTGGKKRKKAGKI